jgi:cyanoexosortase B-associated protein
MLLSAPKTWNLSRAKLVLLLVLMVVFLWGTAPGYFAGGKWRWAAPPNLPNMAQLRSIKAKGLSIPGWQTQSGQVSPMSAQWYIQTVAQGAQPNSPQATILMLPQTGSKHQPQVEWTDVAGFERWQSDSYQTLQLESGSPDGAKQAFTTRFFRAWTRAKTYAVVQWYAQPQGGSPSATQWYLADRIAQLSQQRIPWVAVSILVPMEPLGDLNQYRDTASQIAQATQTGLSANVFNYK